LKKHYLGLGSDLGRRPSWILRRRVVPAPHRVVTHVLCVAQRTRAACAWSEKQGFALFLQFTQKLKASLLEIL
jgi:hypothetical protein